MILLIRRKLICLKKITNYTVNWQHQNKLDSTLQICVQYSDYTFKRWRGLGWFTCVDYILLLKTYSLTLTHTQSGVERERESRVWIFWVGVNCGKVFTIKIGHQEASHAQCTSRMCPPSTNTHTYTHTHTLSLTNWLFSWNFGQCILAYRTFLPRRPLRDGRTPAILLIWMQNKINFKVTQNPDTKNANYNHMYTKFSVQATHPSKFSGAMQMSRFSGMLTWSQ